MGQMNVTNALGLNVNITKLEINQVNLVNSVPVKSGSTYFGNYNDASSAHFADMILEIECNSTSYHIDLNKDHWFGDNDHGTAYPGSDYNVNLILMGFDDNNIVLMQAYGKTTSASFEYCNDVKRLQPQ